VQQAHRRDASHFVTTGFVTTGFVAPGFVALALVTGAAAGLGHGGHAPSSAITVSPPIML
jgi:hypothetical protein